MVSPATNPAELARFLLCNFRANFKILLGQESCQPGEFSIPENFRLKQMRMILTHIRRILAIFRGLLEFFHLFSIIFILSGIIYFRAKISSLEAKMRRHIECALAILILGDILNSSLCRWDASKTEYQP